MDRRCVAASLYQVIASFNLPANRNRSPTVLLSRAFGGPPEFNNDCRFLLSATEFLVDVLRLADRESVDDGRGGDAVTAGAMDVRFISLELRGDSTFILKF